MCIETSCNRSLTFTWSMVRSKQTVNLKSPVLTGDSSSSWTHMGGKSDCAEWQQVVLLCTEPLWCFKGLIKTLFMVTVTIWDCNLTRSVMCRDGRRGTEQIKRTTCCFGTQTWHASDLASFSFSWCIEENPCTRVPMGIHYVLPWLPHNLYGSLLLSGLPQSA